MDLSILDAVGVGGLTMIYVIRVLTRHEDETIELIKKKIDRKIAIDSFSPKRRRLKKYEGRWQNVEERCFPGLL